jgi:signal transduction histidine kinase
MEGAIVDTCASAQEALECIDRVDYDAIVTDIKMPGMDGLALLTEIHSRRPQTPTILITGHGEHDLAVQALRGGAYDFIQKPIERDYFVAALERAVHVRQLSRQVDEQQSALERQAAELEQIVADRTEELREANRIKDEFLAIVSHELRTPLNSILGWAQLIRSGNLKEDATARALQTIVRSTKALNQIIDDLLDVSRIITGKLRLVAKPVEIMGIVQAALEVVRPAADAKSIRVHVLLDPSAGLISGDPHRLQQVIWNLLSNAIKFTPARGNIEVILQRVESNARLRVIDSGEGIGEEFLPYVFDRFRQADNTSARAHGGLGLGLSIVRHIVEMHGGSVSAESQGRGKGACFTVSLPLVGASMLPDRQVPYLSHVRETNRELVGLRIMVVDDEPDTLDLVAAMLEQRGAKVVARSTSADALEVLKSASGDLIPDLLISDIGMPEEDGFDLIKQVRALGPRGGGTIPAVALTAYAGTEIRTRVLAAGFQPI